MLRKVCFALSFITFLAGLLTLIPGEINPLGAVIGISPPGKPTLSFPGIFLMIVSCALFFAGKGDLEKRIKITSSINHNPALVRSAIEATKNETIQREMNHLMVELSKGNIAAGLGRPGHIEGTNIFYLRGSEGARLFYRQTDYGYDVVGKASGTGKKNNEERVIRKLKELYHR